MRDFMTFIGVGIFHTVRFCRRCDFVFDQIGVHGVNVTRIDCVNS